MHLTVKITVFLVLALISAVATSPVAKGDHQKVVFLTSLNTKNVSAIFRRNYYQTYVQKLEERFRSEFERTQYVIEIVHDADQFDLWSVLHDPTNVAVFWLSHASLAGVSDPILRTHKMIDARGFDITPAFEKTHPNLRFLAVIGCFSQDILNSLPQISQDPKHPTRPYLRLFTFHDRVDAKKGLKQAILESKKILEIPEIRTGYRSPCPQTPGYRVRVDRTFALSTPLRQGKLDLSPIRPAGRLMMGQQILDAFPRNDPGGDTEIKFQTHEVFVPKITGSLPSLRIDVGENDSILKQKDLVARLDIGNLNLTLLGNRGADIHPWGLWQMPSGKAIGIFSRIFKPQPEKIEDLDLSAYEVQDSEFRCEPMPSYDS